MIRARDNSIQMAQHQSPHARHQVSQVVGQIRVVALGEIGLADLPVLAVGNHLQEVVAHRIRSVFRCQIKGVHHIAQRLAHLPPVRPHEKPPHVEVLIEGQPGGFQHRRPEDGVGFEDVLAD